MSCTETVSSRRHRVCTLLALTLLSIVSLNACGEPASQHAPFEPQFGPGGGGPPVKVTATDPASAEQESTLDVRVLGSNFEPGSTAEFKLNGVTTGKVHTNATTYVSSGELRANISIDVDADLGLYDVEVRTPPGKKGVGTELFEVQPKSNGGGTGSVLLTVTLSDAAGDRITSDIGGPYDDGLAGIEATLARQFVLSTYGAPAPSTPRQMCFDFGTSTSAWFGIAGPLCATTLWNTTNHDNDPVGMIELATGEMTANTRFIFRSPIDDRQVWVQFGDSETFTSPNRAFVRRLDDDTWEIETTTQFARVLREGPKVKGRATRDTLGFVQMPFLATLRRK